MSVKKRMPLVISKINYVDKNKGYKTGLQNYHSLSSWVKSGNVIDYITRSDKCLVFDDDLTNKEVLQAIGANATRVEKLDWFKKNLKINHAGSKSGLYSMLDNNPSDYDLVEIKKELVEIDDQVFYEGFLSLGDLGLDANILTKNDWHKLITDEFKIFFKRQGFDLDNLKSFYSIHGNTENPHIHFYFYEKTRTRKKWKLNLKDMHTLNFKIQNKLMSNIEYNELMELTGRTWDSRKLVVNYVGNYLETKQEVNAKDFIEACLKIKKEMIYKNNKSYKLANSTVKDAVETIKCFMYANLSSYKKLVDNYQENLKIIEEFKEETNNNYLKSRVDSLLEKEKKDFDLQVGNKIIKSVLKAYSETENSSSSSANAKSFANSFLRFFYVKDDSYKMMKKARKIFEAETYEEYENLIKYSKY